MERLTTRPQANLIMCMECCEFEECEAIGCGNVDDAIGKLKAYEDAEEQGLLLRLPCKVGDMVWWTGGANTILRSMVTDIDIWGFEDIDVGTNCCIFKASDFGKTVFLTKEEAEQALKGGVE